MFRNTLLTVFTLLIATTVLAAEGETKPAADKRPTKIWNRTGPLGDTPKYVTDAYPLSDQQNKGSWIKFEPMSDVFEIGGKAKGFERKYNMNLHVFKTPREKKHWHQPLFLIFDSETMPQWFGMPDDNDLPSTFSVEYVRAWKQK